MSAPTFATVIAAARGRWGKRAVVRLTWHNESYVACAGHTTTEGTGVAECLIGVGASPTEAFAALTEKFGAGGES